MHQWIDGDTRGDHCQVWSTRKTTRGNTKARGTGNQLEDAEALRHSAGTQKSREISAAPRMGTARGPRALPAYPAAAHPGSDAPPQNGPKTWPQGLKSRQAGAFAPPLVGARQR